MSWDGLIPLSVDLFFLGGMLLLFIVDLAIPKLGRAAGYIAALVLAATFIASFYLPSEGEALLSTYQGGAWPLFFKRLFLVGGFLTVLGGIDFVATRYTYRQAEYYLLLMASIWGMMLLPGARELILLLVCFELMGLPLYFLAAFGKNDTVNGEASTSPEAGLKLYLVGAVSTTVTLLGISLLYGMAGSTHIAALAQAPLEPLLLLGMALVIAGMGYKIGVAPFHMWVADTYEGAGTPFVAFLSVAPKAAGFAALIAIFIGAFQEKTVFWVPAIVALSAFTLVVGNLLALAQTNIKRMLAFSGVGQIGYMLMGLACANELGMGMLLFYLAGYVVTNIGAFMIVEALARSGGDDSISSFNGLGQRSPWLGLAMLLFVLSLAGIPFVVGFWAKLYVFMAAWNSGLEWLVIAGAAIAVLGLFYYLQVARAIYMKPAASDAPIKTGMSLAFTIVICLAAVVGMGAYPEPFLNAVRVAVAGF